MGLTLSVQEFLDSLPSKGTKKVYKSGIKKFVEWYGKPIDVILQERKDDLTQRPNEDLVSYRNRASNYGKIIERFHAHLLEEGYKINTAKSLTNGLRQLFRYYQMDVKIRNGASVNKTVQTQRSFPLTIEHVRRMYGVANFRERVILSTATDLGLRVSDFLNIEKNALPDLSLETPISFDVMTEKEDVIARGFLSQETVELLRKYLETLPEDNPYLFPSNQKKLKPISKSQIGNLLRDLAEKAGIKINNGKRLTFHCFRKMFLSASIDSGVGLTAGKIIVGKTVKSSDSTYLTTVNLKEKFIQVKKFLTINQESKVETIKIESLKNAITKLQEDLTTQEAITKTISEENLRYKSKLKELSQLPQRIEALEKFVQEWDKDDNVTTKVRTEKQIADTIKKYEESGGDLKKLRAEIKKCITNDEIDEVLKSVKQ